MSINVYPPSVGSEKNISGNIFSSGLFDTSNSTLPESAVFSTSNFTIVDPPSASTSAVTTSTLSPGAKTEIGVDIGVGNSLFFAMGIYNGWKFRMGPATSSSSQDGQIPTVDTPLKSEAATFQPAPQEYSMPRTNSSVSSAPTYELSESRLYEMSSAPIHQTG